MKQASLVLSGGGSLGLAHIGALRVLEQHFSFRHYYGVSAGAIVCAAHACGKTASEISDIIHTTNILSLAFDFSSTNFGLVRGEKVMRFLEEIFEEKTFEDLEANGKSLRIYATDFTTGDRVCFCSGSLAKAVRSSISVPILFEPFWHEGKWLLDGGLSGNFPVFECLSENPSGEIVAVDVATSLSDIDCSKKTLFGKPKSMRKMMERTFRIFFKTQQAIIPADNRVLYIRPDLCDFTTLDMNKWKEIEAIGELSAKAVVEA